MGEGKLATIIATHDDPNSFPGVWKRRETVLIAEIERLRAALDAANERAALALQAKDVWRERAQGTKARYEALRDQIAVDAL
jgi:hypothetical protein